MEDALLFVAACIARDEGVRSVLGKFVKDVDDPFVELPHTEHLVEARDAARSGLTDLHLALALFEGSLAFMDVVELEHYDFDVEVLVPVYQRIRRSDGLRVLGSPSQVVEQRL